MESAHLQRVLAYSGRPLAVRDMRLKVLTLNAMVLEALSDRIDSEQEESSFQKK